MFKEEELKDFVKNGYKKVLQNISIDCVIFGFYDNQLKILLNRWRNTESWGLPGGYIYKDEHVDESARRILEERTGLTNIFLQQFYLFGEPDRTKAVNKESISKAYNIPIDESCWILQRFVSLGYYALVDYTKVTTSHDDISGESAWWDIPSIPQLIFDHNDIAHTALKHLRLNLNYQPIGINLLPEKFTMPELQKMYETILGKSMDRRNFQKKMLTLNILQRLEERKSGGAHKSPFLYKFDKKNYAKAIKEGLKFDF